VVLDVLSDESSRDYDCDIKVDEAFETTVHELRTYFGFFNLTHTCESILRFESYDGTTNYVKCKTGGLQGSSGIHGFLTDHVTSGTVSLRTSLNFEDRLTRLMTT
jgi:hypothetical protein